MTIATLGPSVRLVVFQFLMKSAQVPAIIPQKRDSKAPPLPPVSGVEVLKSTPKVNLFPLIIEIVAGGNYELVDAWQNHHEIKWNMSFVRFVYCHREHLNPLSTVFVNKRDGMESVLAKLVSENLWATQAHLNPYFENGKSGNHKVLMFGCAGRVPDTEVFRDGRDENNRGIGPKVLLSAMTYRINLDGDEITLDAPIVVRKKIRAPIYDTSRKRTDEELYPGEEL